MISVISFKENLVIPKEEAEELNVNYETNPIIGIQNNKVYLMETYHYYKEDCIEKDGKYYKNQKKLDQKEEIDNYYLYTKYLGDINYVLVPKDNHLVDLFIFATKCRYEFYIKKSIKSETPSTQNIKILLQTIEEKTEKLDFLIDKVKKNTFNSKTNVHVGGGLITTYNELLLKEDACIDDLQTDLNNGWRTIAVCNQPDQRRPDFILGRYNSQLDVNEAPNAKR